MHARSSLRGIAAICYIILPLVFLGCSKDEPPKELLQNHMERWMLQTAGKEYASLFKIASLDPKWVKNGETAYESKATMVLALQQELYDKSTLDEALEKAGEKSAEMPLYRHTVELAKTLPEPLSSSLLERAPKPPLDSHVFIKQVAASGQRITVNFMVRADKKPDGWTFTLLTPPDGESPKGRPRSSFPGKALAIGTDNTQTTIRAFIADTKTFAKEVAEAKDNLAKAKAEALAAKRAAILEMLKPGAIFWGSIEGGNRPTEQGGFIVGEADATGSAFSVNILIPDEFPDMPAGRIRLRDDLEHPYPLTLEVLNITMELCLKNGGLTGSVSGDTAKPLFLPITEEQLNLEKQQVAERVAERKARMEKAAAEMRAREEKAAAERKAREEKEAAEKKQREDAYAAALGEALAPGSGYQGAWKQGNSTGVIGIALLAVNQNSLEATGFIFDPLNRDKRKPFKAVINRSYNAENALVIQTTPGQGLTYNEAATEFQRGWLLQESRDTMTLKLAPGGGWEGVTHQRIGLSLKPIPGFAEEMRKEVEAQEKYEESLNKGISPGATWIGTARCGSVVGEIGLVFEKRLENTLTGSFFDPPEPSIRKSFSALVDMRVKGAPVKIQAEGQGFAVYSINASLRERWLRGGFPYSATASISDDSLRLTGHDCRAELTRSTDTYATLLEKESAATKARQASFMAGIQPGKRYEGTWNNKGGSGEISLIFTSLRTVTVVAELFDPAEPEIRWTYTGSIDPSLKREFGLILQPKAKHDSKRQFRTGGTQAMLNEYIYSHHLIQLNMRDGTFEGRWKGPGASITLTPKTSSSQAVTPVTQVAVTSTQAATPAVTTQTPPSPAPQDANPSPVSVPTRLPAAAMPKAETSSSPAAVPVRQDPPLELAADGKPKIAAHKVSISGMTVQLALQVLAPGKTVEAVRIDNVDGVSAAWRSDGKDSAAPLVVMDGAASLADGKAVMSLTLGEAEKLLILTLTDNGAIAGGKTDLRITVFFTDKNRAMCLLPK